MSSTSSARRTPSAKPAPASSSPLVNAALLATALGYGLWVLVQRGRITWPPHELLSGAYTLAGALALVGPLVLARRHGADGGLGELAWLTGGLLAWVHNAVALAQGTTGTHSWVTPLGITPLGLTILAVLLAGWRLRGPGGRPWSWTNVVGWLLGLFWVGIGLWTLLPDRLHGLALR